MVVQIEIDADIHDYLLSKITRLGESASDVLRRELGLKANPSGSAVADSNSHELSEALESPDVRYARGVVGKFLGILGAAYARDKRAFEAVLSLKGRDRIYFARTKEDIEKSGNSTQPRQIPGSPFWVMTNSPTPQKQTMLKEVLESLGYSNQAVSAAVSRLSV